MKLDDSYLIELIESISQGEDVKLTSIPEIELYMDQVTTFIDSKLSHLKRDKNDKLLTKTMINNYTKSKILLPSKNKKYNKQHIILLILIYYLKQILSINDINSLFTPLFKHIADTGNPEILDDLYSAFLNLKQSNTEKLEKRFTEGMELIREQISSYEGTEQEMAEKLLLVIQLVAHANAQKRLAEKIIDEFFQTPAK